MLLEATCFILFKVWFLSEFLVPGKSGRQFISSTGSLIQTVATKAIEISIDVLLPELEAADSSSCGRQTDAATKKMFLRGNGKEFHRRSHQILSMDEEKSAFDSNTKMIDAMIKTSKDFRRIDNPATVADIKEAAKTANEQKRSEKEEKEQKKPDNEGKNEYGFQ